MLKFLTKLFQKENNQNKRIEEYVRKIAEASDRIERDRRFVNPNDPSSVQSFFEDKKHEKENSTDISYVSGVVPKPPGDDGFRW